MYLKYVAGNKLKHALNYGQLILKQNKKPIINFISENNNNNNNINIYNEYINLIENIDNKYKIAIKLSSFDFDKNYINTIINKCYQKNINVIIDAEQNFINNKYNELTNEFMFKYNKNTPIIYKTYQLYRKDSLQRLIDDNMIMQKNNIILATKLVRGAYWNSENHTGELYTIKQDTDNNYNKTIQYCYNNNIQHNIIASHNKQSINNALHYNKNNIFKIAHLMGMNNQYINFINNNNNNNNNKIDILTYIPYGPYREMFPYLIRRLYENIDTIKYMI